MNIDDIKDTEEYKKTLHCQLMDLSRALNDLVDEMLKPFIPLVKFLDNLIKRILKWKTQL